MPNAEREVRRLLYTTELKRVKTLIPGSRIVDELVLLRGAVRVDVAVINDHLLGYEIKSSADNLLRLPAQQAGYQRVFDKMTLVCDGKHVAQAVKIVPACWGLIVVGEKDGKPYANEIWPAIQNRALDALALAQLLWREEAIELMEYFGLDRGFRDKPRKVIWSTLANRLTIDELKAFVCWKLRIRKDWRESKVHI